MIASHFMHDVARWLSNSEVKAELTLQQILQIRKESSDISLIEVDIFHQQRTAGKSYR